ncbi:MAG: 4'-phosphopantetheinyl transferase superfamily protein [Magnetospirillum sp.]|nr:4'-phosphopantetheinyl transferase superfamily protein [Magnetospirillum sp.]
MDQETWLYTGMGDDSETRARILRRHLGLELNLPPDAVTLRSGPGGKPELADTALGLWFNLSHCPGLLLIATSRRGNVGADLETMARCRQSADLAAREFSTAERKMLAALPATSRPLAFARLWTGKEAVLKARGTGIVQGLAQPDLAPILDGEIPPPWTHIVAEMGDDHYTVSWYTLPIHEAMVVAARADDAAAMA